MPTAVIANPIARGSRLGVRAVERASRDTASLRVLWTTPQRHAGKLTADALADGATSVIAVGGDGTVRDVAEQLAGSNVPLGIVPAGTANLFARNLSLPLRSPAAAARVALRGTYSRVDLGRATLTHSDERRESHVFLVVAGIGHDAEAVQAASLARKRRLGWTAYVDAGVRRFAEPLLRIKARFDDGPPLQTEAWTVLVHNAARIPGGLRVIADTAVDDGLLHVAVVSPKRMTHWVRIAASGMGLARAEGILTHRPARRVSLDTAEPIAVQLDGDALGRITALEAWIEPATLTVRVPEAVRVPETVRVLGTVRTTGDTP